MASPGVRVGVVGATGALGSEVLAALDAAPLRLAQILPIASDRSLGDDIEFQGEVYAVETEKPSLRGLDLVVLCAPPDVSMAFAREALRSEVPCIDASGALAGSSEVPLCVTGVSEPAQASGAPLVCAPCGPALAWSLVLAPLREASALERVTGTVLDAASASGRAGIEALSAESLALFNQQEAPQTSLERPSAFDCWPLAGPGGDDEGDGSAGLATALGRLIQPGLRVSAARIQVPAFVGQASSLWLESREPLEPKRAADRLARAQHVELWEGDDAGPNLRAAAARGEVLVSRPRRDPARERGLQLWFVADPLRLAARNAVELALERLRPH